MDSPVFTALADPMRRQLVVNLAQNSPKTATQLAREYPITRQGILKHLQILKDAGLVNVSQKGREKRFTFSPEPLNEVDEWIQEIGAIWDQRLLRLKTMLENEKTEE